MRCFNWGILGTGNIAAAMSEALGHVPGARRYAVASRSLSTAKAFATDWGFDKPHDGYADLLGDAAVDIVYIATPNACHKTHILDALSAGKHVVCEKPMTLSTEDSAECFAAAKRANCFLMEALWTAFFPAMGKAIELVHAGAIGTPRLLTANFISKRDAATFPNLFDPELGGGAKNDLGIYPVAAALLLAGPVKSSTTQSRFGPTGIDEMTLISLEHENGTVSMLSCGFCLDRPVAVQIFGDKGEIEISETFHQPQGVRLCRESQTITYDLPSIGAGYAHEAIAVQNCIAAGRLNSEIWSDAHTTACAAILGV